MWIIQPVDRLIETVHTPTIWIDDIGAVSLNDGVVTTYYYAIRDSLCGTQPEKVVELILKRPAESILPQVCKIMKATEAALGRAPAHQCGFGPRLVR